MSQFRRQVRARARPRGRGRVYYRKRPSYNTYRRRKVYNKRRYKKRSYGPGF